MFEVYGTKFNVDERYTFLKALGKGAYGVVCSVRDNQTNRKVAIKKICPMAKSVYDAKHTLREIKLLRHCGQHPNVITLVDLMVREDLDELYIGMECMDTDLHRIIQSSQKLSVSHHKHFMYQLILGIEFLHANGILHRDLKPANLLVSKNCDLRISDFGLARRAPEATDDKPLMTEHVVTRWYRPPELMLSPDGKYTAAVDIWSCGCIFAELLGRTPLFPGKNFVHQLQLIFDVIGTPDSRETSYIKNSQAIQFLRSLPNKGAVDLASIYPHASKDAIDFMASCIRFSASKRITVSDALNHPFFSNAPLRDKFIDIPKLDEKMFNFDFEQQELNEKQLREIIINEVTDFTIVNGIRPLEPEKYMAHDRYIQDLDEKWLERQRSQSREPMRRSREFEVQDSDSSNELDLERQAKKNKSSSRALSARTSSQSTSDSSSSMSSTGQAPMESADYPDSVPTTRPHSARTFTRGTSSRQLNEYREDAMEEDSDLGNQQHRKNLHHKVSSSSITSSASSNSSNSGTPSSSRIASSSRSKTKINYEQSTERENESYGNTVPAPAGEPRQKKKSRSFTSRILGSSSLLSSKSSKADKLPSLHKAASFTSKKPSNISTSGYSSTNTRQQNNASPMSCDSADSPMSSNMVEEHKHDPVSSMLPIKNILRKSKRHVHQGTPGSGTVSSDADMVGGASRYGTNPGYSSTGNQGSQLKSRSVTVPQPFSFSHPRNKERVATTERYSSSTSSSSSKRGGLY